MRKALDKSKTGIDGQQVKNKWVSLSQTRTKQVPVNFRFNALKSDMKKQTLDR